MRLLLTCDFPGSFVRYVSEKPVAPPFRSDTTGYDSCLTCGFHQCECVNESLAEFYLRTRRIQRLLDKARI